MNFSYPQVVFQEVPHHISLAFSISGCDLGCKGCHSTETWDDTFGEPLTDETFLSWVNKYKGMVSNVLFYGGEWSPKRLAQLLTLAQAQGLKTTLYTGRELGDIDAEILSHLSFIKTGRYIKALGGINQPQSNQFFFDLENEVNLTHLFRDTNLTYTQKANHEIAITLL